MILSPPRPTRTGTRFPYTTRCRSLSAYDAAQLSASRGLAAYFEDVARALPAGQAKPAANWIMGEVAATLNREEKDIADAPVQAPALAALIGRIVDGTISNKIARDVFSAMWAGEHGGPPDENGRATG